MGSAISCTECSQMAGLVQKVGRDSSKAPSLCAAHVLLTVLDMYNYSIYRNISWTFEDIGMVAVIAWIPDTPELPVVSY